MYRDVKKRHNAGNTKYTTNYNIFNKRLSTYVTNVVIIHFVRFASDIVCFVCGISCMIHTLTYTHENAIDNPPNRTKPRQVLMLKPQMTHKNVKQTLMREHTVVPPWNGHS